MTEILLNNEWLLIIFIILILYLGWRIRKAWKNFLFYLIKRKGRKGEGIAVKLLNKEGYKILDEQVSFPGFLFEPVNHYALLFEGVDITEISPEDGVSAGRNPMIIFNGVKSDRVLSHHTDDLISAGNKYSVTMDIYRYEELSHTEVMYAYPDEFQNKAVDFFKENLNR